MENLHILKEYFYNFIDFEFYRNLFRFVLICINFRHILFLSYEN